MKNALEAIARILEGEADRLDTMYPAARELREFAALLRTGSIDMIGDDLIDTILNSVNI